MELEEAIKILKSYENKLVYEISEKDKEAVTVVLNHITKQEKMIDLMGEFLANLCNGLEVVRDNIDIHIIGDYSATKINKYDKKNIKQYFEKKAEESK